MPTVMRYTLLAVMAALILAGCKENQASSRESGAKEQESIMQRAQGKHPTYQPQNFPTREAVNEWMRRMDDPDKTFYVYLLSDTGQHLGYYVAQTRPISACTFLTPPDRIVNVDGVGGTRDIKVQAPALDGVYYGGGCDSYFFFDAATDAFVEINGLNFFVADQPLRVEADPIRVAAGE